MYRKIRSAETGDDGQFAGIGKAMRLAMGTNNGQSAARSA
jgi:hypothetical protein